jgi:hypothetical protein
MVPCNRVHRLSVLARNCRRVASEALVECVRIAESLCSARCARSNGRILRNEKDVSITVAYTTTRNRYGPAERKWVT